MYRAHSCTVHSKKVIHPCRAKDSLAHRTTDKGCTIPAASALCAAQTRHAHCKRGATPSLRFASPSRVPAAAGPLAASAPSSEAGCGSSGARRRASATRSSLNNRCAAERVRGRKWMLPCNARHAPSLRARIRQAWPGPHAAPARCLVMGQLTPLRARGVTAQSALPLGVQGSAKQTVVQLGGRVQA